MRKDHVRYQLFLTPKLAERLEALAVKPGVTKSAILVDALTAWMNAAGASEVEERFGVRLDRISNQLARIERDGQILIEAFALFVHYQLTVCPPIPDSDVAARASGRILLWVVAHSVTVFAAKHDPDFAAVLMRHLRQKGQWSC